MGKMMNEQLPISKSSPLKARFYDYPYFTHPWHFHTEYEIIYIKGGTGMHFIGNNAEKYVDDDILLLDPDLPYYMKSDEVYWQGGSTLRITETIIQSEKDFMHHAFSYYPRFVKIKNLLEEAQRGIYFPAGYFPQLVDLLESIPVETEVDQITSFLQLLKEMANVASQSVLPTSDLENDIIYGGSRIDKIIVYLNKNCTQQTSLNEISSLATMNPAAFCRFFRSKTGKSFRSYILEMWIGYTCKPLFMGGINILQINVKYGSDTISHFNRSSKKHTGFTPSYYKEMMLTEQE